jgi:hypothetical protein
MASALPGDDRSACGLCAMCGGDDPAWRTFGRAHRWTRDHVELIEHLYCSACRGWGLFEAASTGRKFEPRPALALARSTTKRAA